MPVLHPQSAIYVHGTHVFDWVVVAFAVPLFALFGYLLLFGRCRYVSLAPHQTRQLRPKWYQRIFYHRKEPIAIKSSTIPVEATVPNPDLLVAAPALFVLDTIPLTSFPPSGFQVAVILPSPAAVGASTFEKTQLQTIVEEPEEFVSVSSTKPVLNVSIDPSPLSEDAHTAVQAFPSSQREDTTISKAPQRFTAASRSIHSSRISTRRESTKPYSRPISTRRRNAKSNSALSRSAKRVKSSFHFIPPATPPPSEPIPPLPSSRVPLLSLVPPSEGVVPVPVLGSKPGLPVRPFKFYTEGKENAIPMEIASFEKLPPQQLHPPLRHNYRFPPLCPSIVPSPFEIEEDVDMDDHPIRGMDWWKGELELFD